MLAQDTDKALGDGYICSKHEIGYMSQCPTCAFEKTNEDSEVKPNE